jgi:hypothetical protein
MNAVRLRRLILALVVATGLASALSLAMLAPWGGPSRVQAPTRAATVGSAAVAAGDESPLFWKASYAERRVLAKVKIPCKRVLPVTRSDKTCDLETQVKARKRRDAVIAELNKMVRTAKEGSWEQIQALGELSHLNHESSDPGPSLFLIRHGYPLFTVRCTSAGRPGRSRQRFSRFRCNATVGWDNLSIPLTVWVTGRRTFRWAIA